MPDFIIEEKIHTKGISGAARGEVGVGGFGSCSTREGVNELPGGRKVLSGGLGCKGKLYRLTVK